MSITLTTVILFAVFGVLLFLGVPISISIVVSSIVTAMSTLSWDQITFITMQKMNSGVESFSLLAVPLFILADRDQPSVVTEPFQETVKPIGNITTPAPHECDFLIRDSHLLKHSNLFLDKFCEPGRINRRIPVDELVAYHRPGEILYHGATHRELVKIIIRKFRYYRAHCLKIICFQLKHLILPLGFFHHRIMRLYLVYYIGGI